MTVPYGDFESRILDLIDRASFTATLGSVQNQRLVLGGTRGSGGGEGGPIQPFIGMLPQTEVTFDTDELATLTIPSGDNASLLNNLNRIRIGWTIVPSGVDEQNYTVEGSGNLVEHLRGIDEALGSGWGYTIQDEGITLPRRHRLNFIGASVVAEDNLGDDATDVTISISGGGGGGHTIQDEGGDLDQRTNLNFVGPLVVASDDAGNDATVVTITGVAGHVIQDEGGDLPQRENLNFAGPTVVATDDVGNDATLVTISGSAGWPYSDSIISVDLTDPDADFATVAAAIAVAVAGDLILVGPGTHACTNETLPDGVDLAGYGIGITVLQTSTHQNCLLVGDASLLRNFTAQNTYGGGALCFAIDMHTATDDSRFEFVKCIATNDTWGDAYGFRVYNATLVHCEADADSTSYNGYALIARGSSTVKVHQGRYNGTGGTSTDVGTEHGATVIYLSDPILVNGTINIDVGSGAVTGWWFDAVGNNNASGPAANGVPVKNTSGGAVIAGAVGYINDDGEFKTTTTASLDVNWVVVLSGGANNEIVYVTRRGLVTVVLNGNCSIGDKLFTSTTAGRAQPQSYMGSTMFALAKTANTDGAGGTCEALLYCHTKWVAKTSSTEIIRIRNSDDSDWRTTINGAPAGAVVTYTAPLTSGAENTIVPGHPPAGAHYAKIRLFNETRGTYGLILSVNIGANTITLTENAPAGWANTDVITARSQTSVIGAGVSHMYDADLSDADNDTIPKLARVLSISAACRDTAVAGTTVYLAPWEVYAGAKVKQVPTYLANQLTFRTVAVSLLQQRFCFLYYASGAGTADMILQLDGWWEAAP